MFRSKEEYKELKDNNNDMVEALRELADLMGYKRASRAVKRGGLFGEPVRAEIEWYWEKKGEGAEDNSFGTLFEMMAHMQGPSVSKTVTPKKKGRGRPSRKNK